MPRLVVIGGSDAGISAALRAREIDPLVEPTLVVADRYPNFSICGLPYYLSGEVLDWRNLAHRTREEIEQAGIRLLLDHRAFAIDPDRKRVKVLDADGIGRELPYDRLVIATGAESIKPAIQGLDLPGVYALRWMEDSFAVQKRLTENHAQSAVIVGGGYIGMEMTEALRVRGLSVTVAEFADSVLTTVDKPLGMEVGRELDRHGVTVATGVGIESIETEHERLIGTGNPWVQGECRLGAHGRGMPPLHYPRGRRGNRPGAQECYKSESPHANQPPGHLRSRRLRGNLARPVGQVHLSSFGNHGPQTRACGRRKRG